VPYTFDGPIKIGAILAGANDSSLEALSRYSVPLGKAFQIQDDILGMFGTEEKLGKPVTSDLKEGKKTLLILEALSRANKNQKEIIELNLGNKKVTYNSLKQVRKVIEETGSLEESNSFAKQLVEEAINELNKMKLRKEGKDFLLNIAEYMIKREY
jgi:geranylgeranyl diphosphate synthase type I